MRLDTVVGNVGQNLPWILMKRHSFLLSNPNYGRDTLKKVNLSVFYERLLYVMDFPKTSSKRRPVFLEASFSLGFFNVRSIKLYSMIIEFKKLIRKFTVKVEKDTLFSKLVMTSLFLLHQIQGCHNVLNFSWNSFTLSLFVCLLLRNSTTSLNCQKRKKSNRICLLLFCFLFFCWRTLLLFSLHRKAQILIKLV